MSSDVFVPLSIVLSHPEHFAFNTAYNVDVETARAEAASKLVDWWYVQDCLKPVLMCKFGARETWRHVEIIENEWELFDLRITCSGSFRWWLCDWLDGHNYQYTII